MTASTKGRQITATTTPEQVLRWLWPIFTFLYPLLAWPGVLPNDRAGTVYLHSYYVGVFILLAGLFEIIIRPELRLKDVRFLPQWLWRNKAIALAWAFGLWTLVASIFADDSAASLVGSGIDSSDSALWMVGLVTVLTLVYVRSKRDSELLYKIIAALIASTMVLAIAGLVELAMGHGLLFWKINGVDVPVVNFPQKGHLAGWLVVGCAAAATSRVRWAWWALVPICLAIGATGNRAAFLALMLVMVFKFIFASHRFQTLIVTIAIITSCFLGVEAARFKQGDESKKVVDQGSSISRKYLWIAAYRGIAARPLTGWGGGQFHQHWIHFLEPEEVDNYLLHEMGERLVKKLDNVVIAKNKDGKTVPHVWEAWKAHNQILDVGVMYGIPGIILYISLIIWAFVRSKSFVLSASLLSYSIFMLFWFAIPNTEGAIWALLGAALSGVFPSIGASNKKSLLLDGEAYRH